MRQPAAGSEVFVIAGLVCAGLICSCGPTSPDRGAAPSISPIENRTVFVGEPVDMRVEATDPEGAAVTFSLAGAPSGASLDSSSGLFRWRPALTDTGEKTILFQVSDGANHAATSATFTVVMPTLTETESVRFLRPLGGETYTYGDTLTIAFAVKWCAMQTFVDVSAPGQDRCAVAPSALDGPQRDATDSADTEGRVCRFSRPFEDRMLWIGYYRLPLVDKTYPTGCSISFGGGTARVDSITIRVKDPYVELTGSVGCASDGGTAYQVMQELLNGLNSAAFSVVGAAG